MMQYSVGVAVESYVITGLKLLREVRSKDHQLLQLRLCQGQSFILESTNVISALFGLIYRSKHNVEGLEHRRN